MYCPKCGKMIPNNSFFCQWCGNEILLAEKDRLATAKIIAGIWRRGDYKSQYDSLEAFGKDKLGMEKSSIYKYKSVGMTFFDESGEPLMPDVEKWGYGKLTVLVAVPLDEIAFLRENNRIYPEMPLKELRNVITRWQKIKLEYLKE